MPASRQSLLELHGAVLLFGVAGFFGRWVAADPVVIVFARAAVATLAFLAPLRWRREGWALPRGADWGWLPLTGVVLALHWVAFFHAIQLACLAVALLCYGTAPVFATLLEPLAFRERFSLRALAAGALTLAGVALIVPHGEIGAAVAAGAAWGIVSGLTFAVLSLLNRALVRRHPPLRLALYQDAVAMLALGPLLPSVWAPLGARDLALLVLLGVACTALAHTLYIAALRTLPARTAALVSALEPVYGIALAVPLLGEVPSAMTLAGGALVLGAVLWVSMARAESQTQP